MLTGLAARHRLFAWPLCLAILALWAAPAGALDLSALKPQGYVSDFSRVVDAQSRVQIESYCRRLERATGVQMALVTLPTLEGEPVEDVANALFRQWGIGQKSKDEGLLLLLVTRDRRSRLEVGRGLEPIITDGTAGGLLREMRPALREQNYGLALATAAHELGERISKAKNVSLTDPSIQSRRREVQPVPIPLPVLAGGLLLLLWLFSMGRGRRRYGGGGFLPGMILGSMMSRPWGSTGHGGFGGYDSGDSFGGFGGGDSGGGGASSNW